MLNTMTIIAVASGGAIGATLRLVINTYVNKFFEHPLPLGTLTVNLTGSLIIGMLFAYFHHVSDLSPHIKSFVVTGMLGALTTYSTFAIESFFLLRSGEYFYGISNMFLNLFGTVLLAAIGYLLILHLYKESI